MSAPGRAEVDAGPDGTSGPREQDGPEASPALPSAPHRRRLGWQKLTFLPAFLVALLLATWLWFQQADLDPISENALSNGQVSKALWQQVRLTAISTFFVLIIAIPLGILLTRGALRRATPFAMAIANMGQATPAIGLLALLVIWLGTGTKAALVGIIAYAILPVLANTVAGLKSNDPTLLEAARGIGMSPLGVLRRVELPLAVPLILAGVRTALVLNVGTATLATFGGGGGLGVLITTGITNQRMPVLVLGSILTVSLALLVDWLASLAEVLLRPRGLDADA
ncbi:ABC transporter permease [Streptomyces asoensis]|uniref:Permease n=1 Tax=Streptomyces asoensis TaxID=249586 RepID=A0ABQ3RZU8_9ACTN|nr:ABC transporter permease [Streptomyces asoensis]GGQ50527.1 permease [Streptomyces asoensis]GHI61327.1 permease [Streptomyces asoensis]